MNNHWCSKEVECGVAKVGKHSLLSLRLGLYAFPEEALMATLTHLSGSVEETTVGHVGQLPPLHQACEHLAHA